MPDSLLVVLGALSLSSIHQHNFTNDTTYYNFSKFWTNTGLCPAGKIIHEDIRNSLLSDAMQMNLLYISALPKGAITHIRIHWLLELMQFEEFTQSGTPIYDFSVLDEFLLSLDEMDLYPVIEYMANLSDVFIKNPTHNDFLWEDLSYQVTKHYLNMFGAKKILNWRFETWNEPDLQTYNKLNFSIEDYLTYVQSIYVGLTTAGKRPTDSLDFSLRGPAGLFKSLVHHSLCWSILEYCNEYFESCPLGVLTYHRKGSGENATVILNKTEDLLTKIFEKYPNLQKLPISNDESDPISGWSTPREFQSDVRYAVTLVNIILEHWRAKLTNKNFAKLESISHDNAFLSYHPYEFSQRTLLAHFRMNNTIPPHSQFIQKPVYAALGLLSRLADMSSNLLLMETANGNKINVLKTLDSVQYPLYYSWLIMPVSDEINYGSQEVITLPHIHICSNELYTYIIEIIDSDHTNPVNVWNTFNNPPYPNATIREIMRHQQVPKILRTGILFNTSVTVNLDTYKTPWIMLLRICSILKPRLKTPLNILFTQITHNEVLLTWKETDASSVQCIKTYEVWYRENDTQSWINISSDWHLPFPSFHYAPSYVFNVNGFYKVRSIDVFNRTSQFSTPEQYIEII